MSEQWQAPSAAPAVSERYPVGASEGWRPDPFAPGHERYWDGHHWGEDVRVAESGSTPQTRAAARAAQQARRVDRPDHVALRVFAGLTRAGLALSLVAGAVGILWLLRSWTQVEVWVLQPDSVTEADMRTFVSQSLLVLAGYLLVIGVSQLCFFIWLGMAYTDRAVDPRLLRHSLPVAILSWFLPVVSLWWPVQVVNDLWHASRPDRERSDLGRPLPALVAIWWTLPLVGSFAGGFFEGQVMTAVGIPDRLRLLVVSSLVMAATQLVGTAALIVIVSRITGHLRGYVPSSSASRPAGVPAPVGAR